MAGFLTPRSHYPFVLALYTVKNRIVIVAICIWDCGHVGTSFVFLAGQWIRGETSCDVLIGLAHFLRIAKIEGVR